jgi:ABC-type uncharacterized transport system permease subunit
MEGSSGFMTATVSSVLSCVFTNWVSAALARAVLSPALTWNSSRNSPSTRPVAAAGRTSSIGRTSPASISSKSAIVRLVIGLRFASVTTTSRLTRVDFDDGGAPTAC